MGPGGVGGLVARLGGPAESDAALVGRVAAGRCPDAFAALVRRHGPMVLAACRRVLGAGPDADDAFQAVWLVFLRRAGAVRPAGRVGPFLYGVAVRTARRVRSRRRPSVPLPDLPDPRPAPDRELAAALDAELGRLPAGMRAAVLLCEVEGRSLRDAAADLGVPVGTLASRLARGRQKLADRLRRRGLAGSAAGLSGWLAANATARVPAGLTGGPASPAVETITRGVLAMMFFDRVRQVAAGVALMGGLAAGGVGVGWATAEPPAPPAERPAAAKPDPELVRLWGELGHQDDDEATLALLRLARRPPAEVLAYARGHLKPVALTRDEADTLLAALLGDDPTASAAALKELYDRNPRLVMDVHAVWAKAKTVRDRQRLANLLLGRVQGHDHLDFTLRRWETDQVRGDGTKVVQYNLHCDWLPDTPDAVVAAAGRPARNFGGMTVSCEATVADIWNNPNWKRAAQVAVLLELIGTPEAVAHLRELAAGHPEARSTVSAKRALERIGKRG